MNRAMDRAVQCFKDQNQAEFDQITLGFATFSQSCSNSGM